MRAPRLRRSIVGVVLAALSAASCLSAQGTPRSQLGTVSQMIAGTTIEINYRRPVARGRALFGSLVPWGRVWTPSADSAARITVSRAVEVNGARLAAGTYGLWAIPDSASWTIIFSAVPRAFHLAYPEGRDALRVRATPERGEHMETLAFYFPVADADSAVLRLHWGTTVVPLSLRAVDTGAR